MPVAPRKCGEGETGLTAFKYKAFISYSWSDRAWGEWLHRALETYRTPSALVGRQTPLGPAPARLHPIFKDREEEAAGASIGASIEAAMIASEFLIVLCSPRSAQSKWVNREVAFFKRNRDPSKILTLIVDGEPGASALPGREGEECFPRTLLFKVRDDLAPTDDAEDAPLAADARESGDGKRGAKLKLAAAMLGLGLDDLVRRDERRRTAVRRAWTAGLGATAAGFAGLSVFAFNQRDAAVEARNEAVEARGLAETERGKAVKARDDAEGLIELILTDLKSDLEGYGTLKSVTAIGDRAIGYYDGQDVATLTPDQLGRRARVLLMLGEADNKRGDLGKALARYKAAAETTGEQLRRDQGNAQRIFDHAQSVYWVGYIAWQRGEHESAKKQFTAYYDLAQRLVAIDPGKDEWLQELEYSYSNLGTLAMDRGEAAEAEGWFRKSLEITKTLSARHPGDVDSLLAAGQSYAWLADAVFKLNQFRESIKARESEIAVYRSGDPTHAKIISAESVARYRIAAAALRLGDLDVALSQADAAVTALATLRSLQPEDIWLAELETTGRIELASTHLHAGRRKDARRAIEAALSVIGQFTAVDGARIAWTDEVAPRAQLVYARVLESEGDATAAGAKFSEVADALRQRLTNEGPAHPSKVHYYCDALAGIGRNVLQAPTPWDEIAERLGPIERSLSAEGQGLLAQALMQSGKPRAAASIVSRLKEAGYMHPEYRNWLYESGFAQ